MPRTKYLRATGDTNVDYTTWAASGAGTIALCVDDAVGAPDDATTYLNASHAASTGKSGYLDFEAFTEPHRSIVSVTPFARNNLTGGGGGGTYTARLYFRGKAAYTDDLWWSQAGSYATWTDRTATPYTTCPDTAAAWVQADLSAPQIKVNSVDVSNIHTHQVTSTYVIVSFLSRGGMGGVRRSLSFLAPLLGAGLGTEHVPGLARALWDAQRLVISAEEWRMFLEMARHGTL